MKFDQKDADLLRNAADVARDSDMHVCADALVRRADEIEAAMQPDLELPPAWGEHVPEDGAPLAAALKVGTVVLQFVNWFNYEGWEVRRSAMPGKHNATALGWVVPGAVSVRARKTIGSDDRSFDRLDEALRWLLGWSS